MTAPRPHATVRLGGLALIVAAVLFVGIFSYLAAAFDYPDVLDGQAADVLPALLATGPVGRGVWALYALVPLLLLPGGVAAALAFRQAADGLGRLAQSFALLGALAMVLGLARWPTVHWALATAYVGATPETQGVLAAVFDGLNLYLGNFVGEFVGEVGLYGFFAATALAAWRDARFPRWIGPAGLAVAAVGAVALFRNVTDVVDPASEVANLLIPVWLVVLGGALTRWGARPATAPTHAGETRSGPARPETDASAPATPHMSGFVPWG